MEVSRILTEYCSKVWHDFDVVKETFDSQDRAAWDLVRGSFLYGPVAEHPDAWLSGHGWAPCAITTVAELGRQSGRIVPPDFGRPDSTQVWRLEGTYAASAE